MSPVLLVFLAVTLGAVYVVARRRAAACAPALSDTAHYSLDWVTSHDLSPLAGGGRETLPPVGWRAVAVEGVAAAGDLLDALEAAGYEELELLVHKGSEFVVRWR